MVAPGGNCLSQNGEGRLTIARRSPCHRAGEVNRTVADSSEGEGSAGRCEGAPRSTDWIMLASELREETSEALSCF
jgi:hypothetical protein